MALPIFLLGKLAISTDNMPYCFGGFTAQSAQWCLSCLIYAVTEFVLKAARIKASLSFFKKTFLSHPQDSSQATFEFCRANSFLYSFQFLSFSSFLLLWCLVVLKILFFNKHLLLQNHLQQPNGAIPQVAMQGFVLFFTHSSTPINPFLSSFLGRYSKLIQIQ